GFYALWCLGSENPPMPGGFVVLYLVIIVPWAIYRLSTEPRKIFVEIPTPANIQYSAPASGSPAAAPQPEMLAAAAKAKYEATLRLLQEAGLDEIELHSARAAAKQNYLRELDKLMK